MRLENVDQFIWWHICAVNAAEIEQRVAGDSTFFNSRLMLQLKNNILASINTHRSHSLSRPVFDPLMTAYPTLTVGLCQ